MDFVSSYSKFKMQKSKLFQLLNSLTIAELRRLKDFVNSPYHNKHKLVIKLLQHVIKATPNFNEAHFTKESLGKVLFKNKAYKIQQVSDVLSYLTQLVEEFIALEHFNTKKLVRKQFLLSQYNSRNMQAVFQWTQGEYRQLLSKSTIRNQEYYLNEYYFESEVDSYLLKNETRKSHQSLQNKAENLDQFFLYAKLKICCEMINRQNIIATNYKITMLDNVLNYLTNNHVLENSSPGVKIYYHILLTLTDPTSTKHYYNLLKLLEKNHVYFLPDEARQMYDFAQNYCIKKINSGNTSFAKELLNLYKYLLKIELIFEGKYLSQWDYKNITTIALRQEDYDWTKNFLLTYKHHIAPEFRENAFAYNMSTYYYATEKYKEALKLLQKVEFTDVFYHLGSKSLLLKAYYETDNGESFYSLIAAFRVYLRRNKKISDVQVTNHFNLINLAKRCFDLKYNNYSTLIFNRKLQGIKSKIEGSNNIANIVWLKEKVNEFEK